MTPRAVLSTCGTYRYRLTRSWSSDPRRVLWVMLNPSTADATLDDPTIRRCVAFSRAWGYGGLEVVNLFALRTAYPAELASHADPVGPLNDRHLAEAAGEADLTVAAWGAHAAAGRRARAVLPLLDSPVCLGRTKAGAPRHPLYVLSETRPEVFA